MPPIAAGGIAFIWLAFIPANAAGAIAPKSFAAKAFIAVGGS